MSYTAEQAAHLTSECARFVGSLQALMLDGLAQSSRALPELAKTYLNHGVGRRLSVMRRSLAEIFDLFPPSRQEPLSHELGTDVQVRLHAFVINLSGVFDNWAWAFVHRHGLLGRLGGRRENVGLFNTRTQRLLPEPLEVFLTSQEISSWQRRYLKGYRDALAHRIPLYIPPATFTRQNEELYNELQREKLRLFQLRDWERLDEVWAQQDAIGSACYQFLHEYSAAEDARPVLLHPQILSDSATVIEFGNRFYPVWHEHR